MEKFKTTQGVANLLPMVHLWCAAENRFSANDLSAFRIPAVGDINICHHDTNMDIAFRVNCLRIWSTEQN